MTARKTLLTIEISQFENGAFYALPVGELGWGVSHSITSVPDLLRNTAQAIEIIAEFNPPQLANYFAPKTQDSQA